MNSEVLIAGLQPQKSLETSDEMAIVISLAEKLDFLDIQLLRKFYMTGKSFPFDSQPYCFPILYREMKANHQIKVGVEALRKRLDNHVKHGLLKKCSCSNPTTYLPIEGKENVVRAAITRFFLVNGLSKFL